MGLTKKIRKNYNWVTLAKDLPKFKQKIKLDTGGFHEEFYDEIEATLEKIEAVTEEYQGEATQRLRFTFADTEDVIILTCGRYTVFSRAALNKLANLNSFDNIRLAPWSWKDKDTNKIFTTAYVSCNGVDILNKYSKEEIPQPITTTVGKKTFTDSSPRDEFFDQLIEQISAKIVANKKHAHAEEIEEVVEVEVSNF